MTGDALAVAGLDGATVEVPTRALEHLSSRLSGPILRPGAPGFAAAIEIWNAMSARTPALVVQPASANEVSETVRFAADHGLVVSVKGGGHNIAGTSLADGGLTLDLSRMRAVSVDARRGSVHAGGGCLLGDVDRATQEHGLATVMGGVSQTGVAGLTLGGGFGYLTRRFGWTVDNLEEVEIVTADGQVRRAAGDEHEDLFWALRGGGGNFGVVTRFTFSLHPVGPQITGGIVVWDAEEAADVVALYRDLGDAAPAELTLMLVMRAAPPSPRIPERWHGRPIVTLIVCHTGRPSDAARDLVPIRAVGRPVVDAVGPMPYVELQSMLDAAQPNGLHNYWKSEFFADLPDGLLDTYRRQGALVSSPLSQAILFQLGGAVADHDPAETPFAHRQARHIFFAAGCWRPDDPDAETHLGWARSAWDAVRPYALGGNYVNVQMGDEGERRLEDAYGPSLEQLARVKGSYDPDNFFRVNRNISPAATAARSGTAGSGRLRATRSS